MIRIVPGTISILLPEIVLNIVFLFEGRFLPLAIALLVKRIGWFRSLLRRVVCQIVVAFFQGRIYLELLLDALVKQNRGHLQQLHQLDLLRGQLL